MQHFNGLNGVQLQRAWLTIGSFDGVHLGHQAIIRQLTAGAHAEGAPAVVLTFHPHPAVVLKKRPRTFYLTMPHERAAILADMQVDVLITHPFDPQVAALSARAFLERLKAHLDFRRLWVGHDFAMGHNREGDLAHLRRLGRELSYQVQEVMPVELEDEVVSSSAIRAHLSTGEVTRAARLLGRLFRVEGRVVEGQGRGRGLGLPTANLAIDPQRMIPGAGVYVCRAYTSGGAWGAVANIGVRPTFEDSTGALTVEAHLLDFNADLYGQDLGLEFMARVRGERRFPNPQALVAQIQADIAFARELLEKVRSR